MNATSGAAAPRAEYDRRLEGFRREAARRARIDRLLGNARLVVFASAAVLAFLAFGSRSLAAVWLVPPALLFAILLVVHEHAIRGRERAERAVALYERGLARLEHRWAGQGHGGERFRDPDHPYAEDLDLFGAGSLFELLCEVRTRAAEDTLAGWLLAPAEPDVIRARQEAVAELVPAVDLRQDLALLGRDLRAGLQAEPLRAWGEGPAVLASRALPWAAATLSALSLAALGAWLATGVGPIPFAVALAAQGLFGFALRGRVQRVVQAVESPARDLALFSALLARLERERFAADRLRALRAALDTEGVPPSRRIARLCRLVELLDARRNQFFVPLGALLLWTVQLALAVERWRSRCGPRLASWVEILAELESLSSLARWAYERPGHSFPEILPRAEGGPRFEAEAIGHPLIPSERCVCNDVALGGERRVLIVSGSNMSGKSTLLRTVGSNAVLALAGAPVPARGLRLTPLAIGASIRIQDSLQEGSSRFYAEITRLRRIMALAEEPLPVLFLLDEILHGTNSHDRGIGAEAVIRGLVERGAIGLVTTHDLALARVAEALAPRGANVHFEDHLEDGRIAFDYRMREGVVAKSNALALMRAVGLEV